MFVETHETLTLTSIPPDRCSVKISIRPIMRIHDKNQFKTHSSQIAPNNLHRKLKYETQILFMRIISTAMSLDKRDICIVNMRKKNRWRWQFHFKSKLNPILSGIVGGIMILDVLYTSVFTRCHLHLYEFNDFLKQSTSILCSRWRKI